MIENEKIKIFVNGIPNSKIFSRVVWSGAIHGTARKLEVEYEGEEIAEVGDIVMFDYEEEQIFVGKVFSSDKKGNSTIKSFSCYDNSIFLNKNNFVKNFFKKKPSEIAKEICGELSLDIGKLPKDEVICTYPAIDRTGYEIILNAYTIQHRKNKRVYSVVCNDNLIEIVEQGELADVLLKSDTDIYVSNYGESIEDMVNQIIIYKTEKEKAKIINKVANEEDKEKYGLFQRVMEYEKDKDNIENARDMLKSLNKTATISCLGNILIQSGYSIGIQEPNTGLVGEFLVERDTHIFEGETHKCEITLAFDNVMDKVQFENKEKSKKTKKKKKDKIDELFPKGWDKK